MSHEALADQLRTLLGEDCVISDEPSLDLYSSDVYSRGERAALVIRPTDRDTLPEAIADITRAGYLKALQGLKSWSAGGLIQALDMSATPYVVSTKTRVLKPDFEKKSWTVVADYASPSVKDAK